MASTIQKRLLVVGIRSKIAEQFIRSCPSSYALYGTYNRQRSSLLSLERQYAVNLGDSKQINAFLNQLSGVTFDAVLFFAATYNHDPEDNSNYFDAYQKDLQLNAASIVAISKGLALASGSKLFLFGDAGLEHPKKGFSSYSISKFAIADIARILAVELAPHTATFCLRLGPTLKEGTPSSDDYYRKGLLEIATPVDGLVNLLQFLIAEPNFNATGCVIDYDGGAYIKRLG
jgi:NAD(P)-dependent dehydrogenase (short-subunit alcohol dehydrogenase family)